MDSSFKEDFLTLIVIGQKLAKGTSGGTLSTLLPRFALKQIYCI